MLKLTETRRSRNVGRRLTLLAGLKVSRKYRQACIRRHAYRKLKAIVPSIANQQKVPKIRVIEEAIKYIDELHQALLKKAPALFGHHQSKMAQSSPPTPEQFVLQLLQSTTLPVTMTTPEIHGSQPPSSSPLCACVATRRLPCAACIRRQRQQLS